MAAIQVERMKDPNIIHFTGPVNPTLAEVLNPYAQPPTAKPWGYIGALRKRVEDGLDGLSTFFRIGAVQRKKDAMGSEAGLQFERSVRRGSLPE